MDQNNEKNAITKKKPLEQEKRIFFLNTALSPAFTSTLAIVLYHILSGTPNIFSPNQQNISPVDQNDGNPALVTINTPTATMTPKTELAETDTLAPSITPPELVSTETTTPENDAAHLTIIKYFHKIYGDDEHFPETIILDIDRDGNPRDPDPIFVMPPDDDTEKLTYYIAMINNIVQHELQNHTEEEVRAFLSASFDIEQENFPRWLLELSSKEEVGDHYEFTKPYTTSTLSAIFRFFPYGVDIDSFFCDGPEISSLAELDRLEAAQPFNGSYQSGDLFCQKTRHRNTPPVCASITTDSLAIRIEKDGTMTVLPISGSLTSKDFLYTSDINIIRIPKPAYFPTSTPTPTPTPEAPGSVDPKSVTLAMRNYYENTPTANIPKRDPISFNSVAASPPPIKKSRDTRFGYNGTRQF